MTVGAVFLAGGIMFIAGSQQLVGSALQSARILTVLMVVTGAVLLGVGVSMRQRTTPKTPVRAKAATKKRHGAKK